VGRQCAVFRIIDGCLGGATSGEYFFWSAAFGLSIKRSAWRLGKDGMHKSRSVNKRVDGTVLVVLRARLVNFVWYIDVRFLLMDRCHQ
jgi:hypothetical protein